MGKDSLEQKIEKVQQRVIRTKAAYDEAVDDLQKLLDKQTALRKDELMKAIEYSGKTYDKILRFITGGCDTAEG